MSGTVLSFELGLLWPAFMGWAGEIIGLLFSLEGFAFFAEAIFLGIYLYGWQRVPPKAHWAAGILVAGRYGQWEYSSMEDAILAGRACARRLSGHQAG